jgi:hypothetical protein
VNYSREPRLVRDGIFGAGKKKNSESNMTSEIPKEYDIWTDLIYKARYRLHNLKIELGKAKFDRDQILNRIPLLEQQIEQEKRNLADYVDGLVKDMNKRAPQ